MNTIVLRSPLSRRVRALAAATVVTLLAPADAAAQTYWRVPAALAGALVGAGAGYVTDAMVWGGRDLSGPTLSFTPVGVGLGAVVGFMTGLGADRRLARGENLSRGSRVALRTATFLTPVATGVAIAFAIINPSDEAECVPSPDPNVICTYQPPPEKTVSDETVALVAIGGGAIIGFLVQHKFAPALWPKARVNVTPTGRGIMLSIPVGW
jgi:hypothetical protein